MRVAPCAAHRIIAAASVLSLALGIGANTAGFTEGDQSSHFSYRLFTELRDATSPNIDVFALLESTSGSRRAHSGVSV